MGFLVSEAGLAEVEVVALSALVARTNHGKHVAPVTAVNKRVVS